MLRTGIRLLTLALGASALLGASTSLAGPRTLAASSPEAAPVFTRAVDEKIVAKLPKRLVPDLEVAQFAFLGDPGKTVKVKVANTGAAAASPSVLRLTVRRIDGIAVGRVVEVGTPAIAAGADAWVAVATDAILPNAVAVEATTFKLDADATGVVAESDEGNNLRWHNL